MRRGCRSSVRGEAPPAGYLCHERKGRDHRRQRHWPWWSRPFGFRGPSVRRRRWAMSTRLLVSDGFPRSRHTSPPGFGERGCISLRGRRPFFGGKASSAIHLLVLCSLRVVRRFLAVGGDGRNPLDSGAPPEAPWPEPEHSPGLGRHPRRTCCGSWRLAMIEESKGKEQSSCG